MHLRVERERDVIMDKRRDVHIYIIFSRLIYLYLDIHQIFILTEKLMCHTFEK